ncbi:MAG: leucine-rich repeat domain-containing protein [Tissierellales bacterium]
MKNQIKLSILLLVIIGVLLVLFSCQKDLSKDFTYAFINDKEISITGYTGDSNNIQVPEYIDDYQVTALSAAAFWGLVDAKTISLPDSIKSIGDNAFYSCRSLVSFHVPKSLEKIGDNVFTNCNSLEVITIDQEASNYTVLDGILYSKDLTSLVYCPPLKNITHLAMPDTVKVIERNAFNGNGYIKRIDFSSALVEIGTTAFKDCVSLVELVLPDGLERINPSAFWSCKALESIKIPSSVTYIGEQVFYECNKLNKVIVKEGSFAHEWYVKNGRSKDITFY